MKTTNWMLAASALVFLVGLIGVVAGTDEVWGHILPYLMWNHLAVIVVCAAAGYRLKRMPAAGLPKMAAVLPRWLIAAGIVGAVAIVPNWAQSLRPSTLTALGVAAIGDTGFSTSSREGKYYARVSGGTEREISETQYEELQQKVFAVFARFWVGFGLAGLFLWNLVLQRQRATVGATAPLASLAAAMPHGPARISTTLIVAIWCTVLLSSLSQLASPAYPRLCEAKSPPLVVALLPFVVFGIAALLAKRSPFYSLWVAQMVDARYGPKVFETFLQKLKPILLFGIATLVMAAVSFIYCSGMVVATARPGTFDTFLFAAGAAFCMMHFILRYRKVPGA